LQKPYKRDCILQMSLSANSDEPRTIGLFRKRAL